MTAAPLAALVCGYLGEPRSEYGSLPMGNQKDPFDELIFIILTTMTQYGPVGAFGRLRQEFPSWEELLNEDAEDRLRAAISVCGLVNQKAPQILSIAQRLKRDFGRVALSPLREMSDEEAEAYLLSLPRVGKKVARCVLMYSLGRDVLPVDAHVLRVATRTGLLPERTRWPQAHDAIHEVVPPEHRYALHVGLVKHGRSVCTHRRPRCHECILAEAGVCKGIR